MAKKATKKVSASQANWPTSINLQERFPDEHARAGQLRYALTNNGAGRMDMATYREVPQTLVDAALAVEQSQAA